MPTVRISADVDQDRLSKPHGEIDYRIEGRILRTTASGPFNNELIAAIPAVISELIAKLVQQGKWGQIVTFHRSALGSPAAMFDFGEYLKRRYTDPTTNPVTALVFGRDIEGAQLMAPIFHQCYVEAGIESQVFEDYSTALYWVESRIKQTSKLLTWQERYTIGDPVIDEQHQEIFLRAGDVIAALTRDGQTMSALRLQRYAHTHFSHEENLMRRLDYPDIEEHTLQHQQLVQRLEAVTRNIANDNLVKTELEELISHWLLSHIASADAKLADYLRK